MINNFIIKRKKLINYNMCNANFTQFTSFTNCLKCASELCFSVRSWRGHCYFSFFNLFPVKPVSGQSILEVYDIV